MLPRLPHLPSMPPVRPDTGSFERMTVLDATFLLAESRRTPMHLGALSVFEGAPFFDDDGEFRLSAVRERIEGRMDLLPRFRRRVAEVPFGQGRPLWVDDERFDIAHHVKVVALEAPGTREQLAELCARLHMQVLDRSRPLWELWFVHGLEDGNVALVEKVHHAMVDGVSGVDVAAALLDLERDPAQRTPAPWRPVPGPDPVRRWIDGQLELVTQPWRWARALGATARTSAHLVGRLGGVADTLRPTRLIQHAPSMTARVGSERSLHWVSVPLDELRAVASAHGATVNDAVLTAVSGAVMDLLEHRGTDMAARHRHLQVLVPVSIRALDEHGELGNRVTAMVVDLPLRAGEPLDRLGETNEVMRAHKQHHQAEGIELALESLELLPEAALSLLVRSIHHQPLVDIIVTNVPGPAEPLFFLGAEMLESVPIVPLGGNLTVGIALLSYHGTLTVGVHSDPHRCPDVEVLLDGLRRRFAELVAAPPEKRPRRDVRRSRTSGPVVGAEQMLN